MHPRLLVALAALLVVAALLFYATLPDVRPLKTAFPKTTAFMELRKRELERSHENARLDWRPLPLARISPNLRRAVLAAEDARFYQHNGVDWNALRVTLEKDVRRGNVKAGASTITQQLAKNLYLSPARTPWRKLREWAIARRMETVLSKNRILELYLNVVEFGRRTYGAEAAARHYFAKPAADLTSWESAILAAVIASPRIYDPRRHPDRVDRRARRILRWMPEVAAGTAGSAPAPTAKPAAAAHRPLGLSPTPTPSP